MTIIATMNTASPVIASLILFCNNQMADSMPNHIKLPNQPPIHPNFSLIRLMNLSFAFIALFGRDETIFFVHYEAWNTSGNSSAVSLSPGLSFLSRPGKGGEISPERCAYTASSPSQRAANPRRRWVLERFDGAP